MPSFTSTVLALATAATLVSAHGFVANITINGETIPGFGITSDYYRPKVPERVGWYTTATDTGFVDPPMYNGPNIICHKDAKNAALSATVAAGDSIALHWNSWPESHKGPVLDYLASCGDADCSTVDKTTLKFFKFNEKGIVDGTVGSNGLWAADDISEATRFTWTTTIPASLKPGNYVLRHEIIALHSAHELNGAQNYPQCINLKVTGSGSELPAGVLATELYTANDPGIHFNIYQKKTSYVIPGPPIAISGGGGAANPPNNGGGGNQGTPTPTPTATTIQTPIGTPTATPTGSGAAVTATGTGLPKPSGTPQCKGKGKGKGKGSKRRRHARQLAAHN
jgi:lytic cellulose monooxygenase (C1-hydroxylating)